MWIIFDHPLDFPDHFIAREFSLDKPTDHYRVENDLDTLRHYFIEAGLICFERDANDDPVIVETWL